MMKALAIFVLCLALYVCAVHSECDPDGNGKPDCTGRASGTAFRNFWDPTRYWSCDGSAEPLTVLCPPQTGYTTKNGCVSWSVWEWVPPCGNSTTD